MVIGMYRDCSVSQNGLGISSFNDDSVIYTSKVRWMSRGDIGGDGDTGILDPIRKGGNHSEFEPFRGWITRHGQKGATVELFRFHLTSV